MDPLAGIWDEDILPEDYEIDEIDENILRYFQEAQQEDKRMMAARALLLLKKPNIIEERLSIVDNKFRNRTVTPDYLLKFVRLFIFLSLNGQVTQENQIFRYIDERVIEKLAELFYSILPLYTEKGYRPSEVFIAMLIYFFINTQSRPDLVQSGLGMHATSGDYVSNFMVNFLRLNPNETGHRGARTFHYGTFLRQVDKLLGSPSEGFTVETIEQINQIYSDFLKRRIEELDRTEAGYIINQYYEKFLKTQGKPGFYRSTLLGSSGTGGGASRGGSKRYKRKSKKSMKSKKSNKKSKKSKKSMKSKKSRK